MFSTDTEIVAGAVRPVVAPGASSNDAPAQSGNEGCVMMPFTSSSLAAGQCAVWLLPRVGATARHMSDSGVVSERWRDNHSLPSSGAGGPSWWLLQMPYGSVLASSVSRP